MAVFRPASVDAYGLRVENKSARYRYISLSNLTSLFVHYLYIASRYNKKFAEKPIPRGLIMCLDAGDRDSWKTFDTENATSIFNEPAQV